MENPILARVIHPYNPLNNDELKLAKDEIITVAQKDDGGWWEGTLNGKSGWFPSNYVVEITESDVHEIVSNGSQVASLTSLDSLNSQRVEYKRMVLQDLIESENAYILEFQSIWDNYLVPLRGADVLKSSEYEALIGNTPEILQLHSNLLLQLRKEQAKPHRDQRIGKVFLECALKLETVHKSYCSNHPKAMQTKDKHKEALNDYMESKGAQQPGILVLILALSQPLRRLEKYPGMLTELERHIEENHKDRGDLQRSIEYYKLIDKNCSVARKQKEMELEVLNGGIKNYEGTDVAQLGEIIYMNLVQVGPELQSRYFVLFANTLLILSHVPESNSLVYEGKIPVSGILLTNVPDTDDVVNAFEIAGPMLEPIMVKCTSKEVKEIWLDHLTRILKLSRLPTTISAVQQVHDYIYPVGHPIGRGNEELQRFSSLTFWRLTACNNFKYLTTLVVKNRELFQHFLAFLKLQTRNNCSSRPCSLCESNLQWIIPRLCSSFHSVQLESSFAIMRRSRLDGSVSFADSVCFTDLRRNCFSDNKEVSVLAMVKSDSFQCSSTHKSAALRRNTCSDIDERSRTVIRRKRGMLVRQNAFDMSDEDIFDENHNYVFNAP